MRKDKLAEGSVYHVFTKSIAGYVIFNTQQEYNRMMECVKFYKMGKPVVSFSRFYEYTTEKQKVVSKALKGEEEIEILAYCLMPTHLHFILKQNKEKGISFFMKNLLSSHTRYFNKKHGRKGPLWESRFQNVLVKDDIQLLHLTRYIHLNPVTAHIVEDPEDWLHSSYKEYLDSVGVERVCKFEDLIDITPDEYRKFTIDQIGYQRELADIKNLVLD